MLGHLCINQKRDRQLVSLLKKSEGAKREDPLNGILKSPIMVDLYVYAISVKGGA